MHGIKTVKTDKNLLSQAVVLNYHNRHSHYKIILGTTAKPC